MERGDFLARPSGLAADRAAMLDRYIRATVATVVIGSVLAIAFEARLADSAFGLVAVLRAGQVVAMLMVVVASSSVKTLEARKRIAQVGAVALAWPAAAIAIVQGDVSSTPMVVLLMSVVTGALFPWGVGTQIATLVLCLPAAFVNRAIVDGSYAWLTSVPFLIFLVGSLFSAYLAHESDRRRAEREQVSAELGASEETFRGIFASAPDAVVLTRSDDDTIVAVNRAFLDMTGYPRDEVVGRSPTEIGLWVSPDVYKRGRNRIEAGSIVSNLEAELRRKDGTALTGLVSARVVRFAGRSYLVFFVRDVSERLRVDRMRRDLLAMLSHDIKNALGNIMGFAEVMRDDVPAESADMLSMLDRISANARSALLLAENFVEAMQLESGVMSVRRAPVALEDVIDDAVRATDGLARARNVRIVHRSTGSNPTIPIDRTLIVRAVANFLTNAVKYSPPHREVTVETQADEQTATIRVRDQGPGVAPEDRPKLFQRFQRAAEGGSGLGLFIARSAAEAHGGKVRAEFPPEGGSIFEITLPREPVIRPKREVDS